MDAMDLEKIKETEIWTLYQQAIDYCRLTNMFTDTDRNYRMYNGDQWQGLKVKGVEKIQYNFIKPIVKYKTGIVLSNLYAIHYSSENFENKKFRKTAEKICELLNKRASKIWEKDNMDMKFRKVVKDAAINDEGILYSYYDEETKMPVNEILNKVDVFYGNENDEEIQNQPYILIKQRRPVSVVQEMARDLGVSDDKIQLIIGDLETLEEAGEEAKIEKDTMCTVVTKLYREDGTIHHSVSTRLVELKKDRDTGLKFYPLAHMLWEEKKGSARGEGEVRQLIPNQLETNKTAMRRALTAKQTAYPQKVYNADKISNPQAINQVGGTIRTAGSQTVDDVNKIISFLNPAAMSPDVEKLQTELISSTRELAGAGDIATGQINPESASGRAILAVQQASQQPLTEHLQYAKAMVEDLARIWLDILIKYSDELILEEEVSDPVTGEETIEPYKVHKSALEALRTTVKIDITPKGAYDKYAQEQSLENLLSAGLLSGQRIGELKLYAKALDDDSVMPKQKLLDLIEDWEDEQKKIAMLNQQAQQMQARAQQFINQDPDAQVDMMYAAAQEVPEEEID